MLARLGTDRTKFEKGLARLQPGSGTSFYDALHLTIRDVLGKVEGRKAVVALTDGVDSYGFYTFARLQPELEKGRTACYFLELNTEEYMRAGILRDCDDDRHFKFSRKQMRKYYELSGESLELLPEVDHCRLAASERTLINQRLYEAARRELREIARQTGGRVYPVKGLMELDPVYTQIAAELRIQYSLGYYPSNDRHDGKWREVRVEVKRPGLVAHARPGYRAPKN
jgi:VWFA-related protein